MREGRRSPLPPGHPPPQMADLIIPLRDSNGACCPGTAVPEQAVRNLTSRCSIFMLPRFAIPCIRIPTLPGDSATPVWPSESQGLLQARACDSFWAPQKWVSPGAFVENSGQGLVSWRVYSWCCWGPTLAPKGVGVGRKTAQRKADWKSAHRHPDDII